MTPRKPSEPLPPRKPSEPSRPLLPREESYLEDESHLDGLIAGDDDEVVGLDDAKSHLEDPASLLPGDLEHESGSLQRWHDVGPAEDAVDPSALLVLDEDEGGYTREGDALGLDEDLGVDALFGELSGSGAPDDGDAAAGVEVLAGLELPGLPALEGDEHEPGALGPDEDTEDFSAELLRRSGRDLGAGGSER